MTDNLKELVAELRYVAQWAEHHTDKAQIINAGADAILALIADAEMNEQLREQNIAVDKACAELEAEVERLKAQEPVGIVDKVGPFGFHVEFSKTLELGTKLYLASGAAQVGANGLTENETSESMSVRGLSGAAPKVEMSAMPADVAKVLYDNLDALYITEAAPAAQEPVGWVVDDVGTVAWHKDVPPEGTDLFIGAQRDGV